MTDPTPTDEQQDVRERVTEALFDNLAYSRRSEIDRDAISRATDAVLATVSAAAPDEREAAYVVTAWQHTHWHEPHPAVPADVFVRPPDGTGVHPLMAACATCDEVLIPAALAARPAPECNHARMAQMLAATTVHTGQSFEAAMDALKDVERAEEWADRLAATIAPSDVLGEHSSANNPWQNALDYAAARPAPVVSGADVQVAARALRGAAEAISTHSWVTELTERGTAARSVNVRDWLVARADALTVADAPAADDEGGRE